MNHTQLKLKPLALAVGLTLASASAFANTEETETPRDLGTMVVTAAGFEQDVTQAPASITVITSEELQSQRYNNLAQALQNVEGIDIGQGTGKTGGLNISMRGMPSGYTLILIDGRRQNAAGNIAPNGFGEYSTSFISPVSAIERIEVIRGPASTLYGSDAMGGVINIITKKVGDAWGGSLTVDQTFHENRDFGSTGNLSLFTSGPLIENLLGLQVRASLFNRESSSLEYDNGVELSSRGPSPVESRVNNLGARFTLTPNADHSFALDMETGRQVYNNDDCQLGSLDGLNRACNTDVPTNVNGYKDQIEFERTQFALTHTGHLPFGTLSSSLMHNTTEQFGRTVPGTLGTPYAGYPNIVAGDDRTLETTNLVVDTKLVAPVHPSHTLTLGGQYWNAEMTDGMASEKFEQDTFAIFAEDEWLLTDALTLTLGARYDHHDAFGGHISPRAYLVANLTDQLILKGGVSQGYKTPDLNDLHEGINGVTGQGSTITIGNPDLKPETSTNFELGAYWDGHNGLFASATIFHNQFDDKIAGGDPVADPLCAGNTNTGGTCSPNINIDEAITQGLELTGRWAFAENWSLSANYTYTDSEQKSGDNEGQPLTNTPEHLANLRLNWNATERLDIWLQAAYRGERARFTSSYDNLADAQGRYTTNQSIYDTLGAETKAYTLFHLGGAYQLADNVTLRATIYNLLDKDFMEGKAYTTYNSGNPSGTAYGTDYAHSTQGTTGLVEEGRRLWISVQMDF